MDRIFSRARSTSEKDQSGGLNANPFAFDAREPGPVATSKSLACLIPHCVKQGINGEHLGTRLHLYGNVNAMLKVGVFERAACMRLPLEQFWLGSMPA